MHTGVSIAMHSKVSIAMQQTLQAWRATQGPFQPPTERRGALATLALAAVQVEVPAWAQSIPLGLVAADPTC
jgi:hypothetical protein